MQSPRCTYLELQLHSSLFAYMALQTVHPHPHPPASSFPHLAPCIASKRLSYCSLCFHDDHHRNLRNWMNGTPLQLSSSGTSNTKQGHPYPCCSRLHISGGEKSPESTNYNSGPPFGVFLHDLLDQAGINTTHARAARQSFVKEVSKLSSDQKSVKISDCRSLDLARAALEVSAEDDALVSHSPVALPVDSYIERLNSMAMEFAGHHMPTRYSTPEAVLDCLDNYFYGYKGFQRVPTSQLGDARGSYLNMVLTRRLGTSVMLGLIYSEFVKILNSWGVIDFSVEMELPADPTTLPRPLVVSDSYVNMIGEAGGPQLLTPQILLVEIMTTLKRVYWPWKLLNGSVEGTDFLKAADAANHGIHMSSRAPVESLFTAPNNSMGAEIASARAAQHRLQRGIWTSTSFGDMRRALAASERLVLLGVDNEELRDYGILLYHCGLYEPSFKYLNQYRVSKDDSASSSSTTSKSQETVALENVLLRLRLILAEWNLNVPTTESYFGESLSDPW